MVVGTPDATEVSAADFYGGKLPRHRLCKMCLAYRRPGVGKEMAVLEAQLGRGGPHHRVTARLIVCVSAPRCDLKPSIPMSQQIWLVP
jgi:hypothetical protein